MPVVNPATEEAFADAPCASSVHLDAAIVAAQNAAPSWAKTSDTQRRRALEQLSAAVSQHSDELAMLLTLEQGKPLSAARDEVQRAAYQCMHLGEVPLAGKTLLEENGRSIRLEFRPIGVVGAITPWNVPLALASTKVASALLAGNTVVLKPSPYTPLATLRFGEIARELLPPGVLNVLSGGDDLGRLMTAHRGIGKITFTGSVATGKAIMAAAAPTLKRLTLELGGNDAALVLDDVDVDRVAPAIFQAAFLNAGQTCAAIKRLYVHSAVIEPLMARLVQIAAAVKVGPGTEAGVQMGPVQNRAQYEKVLAILHDAVERRGRILYGGRALPRPGYFLEPTLIAGLPDDARLVVEEQFGPLLPILEFHDVRDAVNRANDSCFGLGASVWTSDSRRAEAIAAELQAGTIWINQHAVLDPLRLPFGGIKDSGLGREYGELGLRGYTEPISIFTRT